jgi:hypothetical protein
VSWDDSVAKRAAELAHKHNIPAAAMSELMKFDLERASLMNQAAASMIETQLESGRAELQRVYGDKMPEKIELARRAAVTAGVDPSSSQGFVDPQVVKAIVSLGRETFRRPSGRRQPDWYFSSTRATGTRHYDQPEQPALPALPRRRLRNRSIKFGA